VREKIEHGQRIGKTAKRYQAWYCRCQPTAHSPYFSILARRCILVDAIGITRIESKADGVLSKADGGSVTAAEAVQEILGAPISLRNNRRLQAAMPSSRLPAVKTLEGFDFAFQPSINREQIDSLAELSFLERKENVVLLGPPSVGKTHLAISLAITVAQNGRRVYNCTLVDLVISLEEARAVGSLQHRLAVLSQHSLMIVDEIGYLPVSQTGAVLFFQLISRRYERASTILTSNKGFEE